MDRFQDTYRIPSARLPGYDYRSPGWYHVVVCTRDRACTLGRVRNGIVGLSVAGCIVAEEWQRTPQIRPYVHLDAWIVMPNHVHVILGIASDTPAAAELSDSDVETPPSVDANSTTLNVETPRPNHTHCPTLNVETPRRGVSTGVTPSPSVSALRSHSVNAIVGQVKSIATKRIRRAGFPDFAWQPRFWDRVIRSEDERMATRQYIRENPLRWHDDRYYPAEQR